MSVTCIWGRLLPVGPVTDTVTSLLASALKLLTKPVAAPAQGVEVIGAPAVDAAMSLKSVLGVGVVHTPLTNVCPVGQVVTGQPPNSIGVHTAARAKNARVLMVRCFIMPGAP